jgi:hypothetical protein
VSAALAGADGVDKADLQAQQQQQQRHTLLRHIEDNARPLVIGQGCSPTGLKRHETQPS